MNELFMKGDSDTSDMDIMRERFKRKKLRLIDVTQAPSEESISYEDLSLMNNFSEEEITTELMRKICHERKKYKVLKYVRKLQDQIYDIKKITMRGMMAVINTISSIDENSKKMVYKQFNQENVNFLAKETPILIENLLKLT